MLELKAFVFCADICRLYSSARCSTNLLALPLGEGQEDLGLLQHLGNKVSLFIRKPRINIVQRQHKNFVGVFFRHWIWSNRGLWIFSIWDNKQHRRTVWDHPEQTWYAVSVAEKVICFVVEPYLKPLSHYMLDPENCRNIAGSPSV